MRTSEVLEFEAMREVLGRHLGSALGRRELDKVAPHTDRERLAADLAEAGEAIAYLRGAAIRINFGGLPDVEEAVHKLRIEGAALEPKEISDVLSLLDRAADAKSVLTAAAERFPLLGRRGQAIGDFRGLLQDLEGKVLPDGSVSDHASVALGRLRRDMERQKKAIQESLERFLKSHREEGVLQEEFVAIRNERFVVPVIAGQRRKLDGVIHGASSSGHTLFVEPLETIDLNNELVRLAEEEAREVHRILLEITARLRGHGDSIRGSLGAMAELDLIFAKGRFAARIRLHDPAFRRRGCCCATRAIRCWRTCCGVSRSAAIPVSLELTRERRTLLISGPNTGGKTVALKTVGLLSLMAQSGLPVPAAEAEFPIFDQVLADIGDYQSIQESLSTFSAHVSHIREMALDVTPDSLVLLDELGSATDPGGRRRAGRGDCGTLPLGGSLHAGLDAPDGAEDLRGFHGWRGERLDGLQRDHFRADLSAATGIAGQVRRTGNRHAAGHAGGHHAARAPLDERPGTRRARGSWPNCTAASRKPRRWSASCARRRRSSPSAKRNWRRNGRSAKPPSSRNWSGGRSRRWSDSRGRRRRPSARSRRAATGARPSRTRNAAWPRRAANCGRTSRRTVLETQDDSRQNRIQPLRIEEGARVRLKDVREPARVRRLLGNGRIEVEAGFLKMQVSVDDVVEVLPESAAAPGKLPKGVSFLPAPELSPAFQEINVIGQRAEEACDAVDQFLDHAVMATASRVRIVHGYGMGILRKSIHELLGRHPHVAKFYAAPQQEGGAGATIVEIKE